VHALAPRLVAAVPVRQALTVVQIPRRALFETGNMEGHALNDHESD